MKKLVVLGLSLVTVTLFACSGGDSDSSDKTTPASTEPVSSTATSSGDDKDDNDDDVETYDPNRGKGKFTTVELGAALDVAKADRGNKVYGVKCSSCHKLTEERLVGPGWAGVTTRNKPEWIMNFITNTNEMIDKDPKIQAQLELCLVRMPNQNLSDDDARSLLEFMRKNDGIK